MKLHSIRFRLIWIHSAAIAVVVVCIGLIRYQLISYRSHQRFDRALIEDARLFHSRFRLDSDGFRVSTEGLSTSNALALQELEHHFILTDMRGRVLHQNLHNKYMREMFYRGELDNVLRQTDGLTEATANDGSVYRFMSIQTTPGSNLPVSILHLGRSIGSQKEMLREYLIFYLYSVPLILSITVVVGWFLVGRTMKPLEEITRTAERITYENLNTNIVTKHKEEEVQRLVQAFNSMVKRLDESFRQMRNFNADAAHEIRTPLSIIQGETEIALRSPNLPEEIRLVLASNLEELDRLNRIVNDLLILSEAEPGKHVLAKEPVDVKSLLEDLVDQMRPLGTERNIRVEVNPMPEVWIDADGLWLRRAVINLLDNAIKYTRDGDTIEVCAGKQDGLVRISVRDHGIGVLPEDIPHIFDRFWRADPARNRVSGGVGLGLALVKWIAEAHKGSVRVESRPDAGALFEILIPESSGQRTPAFSEI